jgi:hypothetical protein
MSGQAHIIILSPYIIMDTIICGLLLPHIINGQYLLLLAEELVHGSLAKQLLTVVQMDLIVLKPVL